MSNAGRESWGNNLGFLMAAVGSAVGLGNIWAFPYKMGANGGFAFLLVYLVLAVLVGFVVLLGELTLGRMTHRGCVGAYQKVSRRFGWIGWLGILSAFFILSFYTVLGAYCVKYCAVNIGDIFGASFGSAGRNGGKIFGDMLTNQFESIAYTVAFIAMVWAIITGGIQNGIERFSVWAMPALFFLLIAVMVRSVTLDGAEKGLAFMFSPNFKPFEENFLGVMAAASGQLFFSLSLGMAIMVTYGSYVRKSENLPFNTAAIIFSDTLTAIFAGVAVIPAAYALGGEGAALAGPKLLYITLQNVFHSMGYMGAFVGLAFYVLVVIAAVTSAVSLSETLVTFFMDREADKGKAGNRKAISCGVCLAVLAEAILVAADGLGSNGLWVPFQSTFGVHGWNDCWLDFMDLWTEGIMMPLGALLMCLMIGYEMGIDRFSAEITLSGNRFIGRPFFLFCCRYICPVVLAFVLFNQLKSFGIL